MMVSLQNIRDVFKAYKEWVITHPNDVSHLESVTKWTSYFVAGKINKSSIISELIYSFSNLFVLYNDKILMQQKPFEQNYKNKLKYWMTVLHICEVFMELAARHKWEDRGKWTVASTLQALKCICNLVLVYHYKEVAVQHPPMLIGQRNKLTDGESEIEKEQGFKLARSGRWMRSVEDPIPATGRTWQPLKGTSEVIIEASNSSSLKIAETLYCVKPVLHLGSMAYFGDDTWKQWLFSLSLDLTSLYMYDKQLRSLNYEQRVEISRRKLCLLYYLLRSPMFEKHSKGVLVKFLTGAANKVPLAGYICNPILQYMSYWQAIYFYMWAN